MHPIQRTHSGIRRSAPPAKRKFISFRFKALLSLIILVAFGPFGLPTADGQTVFNWQATHTYWDNAAGWSPSGPPGTNDIAQFNLNVADLIAWDSGTGNRQTGQLQVFAGDYTFDGTTATQYALTLNASNQALYVNGASTTLTVRDLHINAANGYGWVNYGATFNLDGGGTAGATLTTGSYMYNYGTFTLTNGAIANHGNTNYIGVNSGSPGVLNVESGSTVTNPFAYLGYYNGSVGTANVTGNGSKWTNTNGLRLGFNTGSTGNLNITSSGSVVVGDVDPGYSGTHLHVGNSSGTALMNVYEGTVNNSGNSYIGGDASTFGHVRVNGANSIFNTTTALSVGLSGTGTLDVENGGKASTYYGYIGAQSGSSGTATVTGSGSRWDSAYMYAGNSGNGSLTISDSGIVDNSYSYIGYNAGGVGTATVTGSGSQWNMSASLAIGLYGTGELNVEDGGYVKSDSGFLGYYAGSDGTANVTGGSSWSSDSQLHLGFYSGSNGNLNVNSGGRVLVGDGSLSSANSISVDDSLGATLLVRNGTITNTGAGIIGLSYSNFGTATIVGSNAVWNADGDMFAGYFGTGTLNVQNSGTVTNATSYIGFQTTAVGTANVSLDGQWNNSSDLFVGLQGNGSLNVSSGGDVANTNGYIGRNDDGIGTAVVTGSGSTWDNSADLVVGDLGTGTLNIEDNGLVKVGGTTYIGDSGTLNLDGGRLEFGTMSWDDFSSINAVSGSMSGLIIHDGYSNVAGLSQFKGPVEMTDVMLTNTGTMYGNANLNTSLTNSANAEIETVNGERMRFAGSGDNSGEFNNYGGYLRFDQAVINQAGGFINGRGQFVANGGWTNQGVMAFSGGNTDIIGDVNNEMDGQIVTSGFSTTTFYDDVVNNGLEIRTAAGSSTVFFGATSGAADYTGTGTVFFEGDLRPGNSPDVVSFEGGVSIGSAASTVIELEGLLEGEFDKLDIAGDLSLDGNLQVDLLNGYELGWNQEYVIADVDGAVNGMFTNLGEGDSVGNYGGMDLFVTYAAGSGNDVALFTAVPEPNAAWLIGLIGLIACRRRRKR